MPKRIVISACRSVPCIIRCKLEERVEELESKLANVRNWWSIERGTRISLEKALAKIKYGNTGEQ